MSRFYVAWCKLFMPPVTDCNFLKISCMKQRRCLSIISFLLLIATHSCSQKSNHQNGAIVGVYVASTPCSKGTRPLPGIPADADCELIKWKLTLYGDTAAKLPASYQLKYTYGTSKAGTPGFIGGGTTVDMEGNLTISKDNKSNSEKVIYRLTDAKTKKVISFLRLNDHLLHLLDSKDRLMIGSAAWSYTLNSINSH